MNYTDNVLIKLKRRYRKDEILEAVIAQNTRYEKEIETLKKELEQLKAAPLTKAQIRESKGQKAIEFLREYLPQYKRSDSIYTYKIHKDVIKDINKTIFS